MNGLQTLKALGHFPNVRLNDINNSMVIAPGGLLAQAKSRQCLCPDHIDEELADYDDPIRLSEALDCDQDIAEGIIKSHKRMANAATGSGSWPAGCDSDYPDIHTAKVFLDVDTFPQHYKRNVSEAELDQVLEAGVWRWSREELYDECASKSMIETSFFLSVETYRLVGIKLLPVQSRSDCNIHIRAKRLRGSTIGIAWFNDGSCDDVVDNHIDSSYQPGLKSCTYLLSHELGHNNNLEHEFWQESRHKSIMSYTEADNYYGFSTGEAPHTLPRDRSWDELIEYYGGEEIPLEGGTEPQPPDPPSDSSDLLVLGTLNVVHKGESIGRIQVVPVTEF